MQCLKHRGSVGVNNARTGAIDRDGSLDFEIDVTKCNFLEKDWLMLSFISGSSNNDTFDWQLGSDVKTKCQNLMTCR